MPRKLCINVCCILTSLYNDCDAVQLIVIGDLNCSTHSTFFDILLQFATDNNVLFTDMNRLSGVFTYCDDSATNLSCMH